MTNQKVPVQRRPGAIGELSETLEENLEQGARSRASNVRVPSKCSQPSADMSVAAEAKTVVVPLRTPKGQPPQAVGMPKRVMVFLEHHNEGNDWCPGDHGSP